MGHESRGHRHGHGSGAIEGRHSRHYDRIARLLMRPLYRRIAADIAATAPEGASVLDVGTGPGVLLGELDRVRPDLDLAGVDLSADMIDLAKLNLADLSTPPELRTADVASLPFDADRFDLVVSTFSSHHWEDPGSGAVEIARVLRGGGRLLNYDFRSAPYDALTRQSGLTRVRAERFRTGWGPFFKSARFEATVD